jgi:hypothetical protein
MFSTGKFIETLSLALAAGQAQFKATCHGHESVTVACAGFCAAGFCD